MLKVEYVVAGNKMNGESFLNLVNKVWPGDYKIGKVQEAIDKTLNITAWSKNELIGCVRILTDGYFFSTITEILVLPEFQKKGVGTALMQMAWETSPSSLTFGVQPGNEEFFEKLGFQKGLPSYEKRKNRNG